MNPPMRWRRSGDRLAAAAHFAAIDAGSNALRLVIARADSPYHITELEAQRAAVRLGHNAFTTRLLDEQTISAAARAFRQFRRAVDRYAPAAYRAVATSAAREAKNRAALIRQIRRKAGIHLEIISGSEEARLVRTAVRSALGGDISPRLIFDLGGGSLELNFMRGGTVELHRAFPLGTVRLMEVYGLQGRISEDEALKLRHHILAVLRSTMHSPPDLAEDTTVACGGNAEALVRLAPGPILRGIPSINLRLLRDRLWQILRLHVAERMSAFEVREDRAEVLGIAALVLTTLGQFLNLRSLLVPGVGVREGVLAELAAAYYSQTKVTSQEKERAMMLLDGARWFARRLDYNAKHAEQVRRLAVSLFDQFRRIHRLEPEWRLLLEVAAVLHDAGSFVNRKAHQRHGEYLIRNSEVPGLTGWRRDVAACLVRFHNGKSDPAPEHKLYSSFDSRRRRAVRLLTALLRIAEKLESDHKLGIAGVEVEIDAGRALFRVQTRTPQPLDVAALTRRAALFEKEFGLKAAFRRAQYRSSKVA